jgi:hypothetical protein
MSLHEAPEAEAAAKLAAHMAVAAQLAETVIRMRQQREDRVGAATAQEAAGLRAERTARHAADRVTWSRTDAQRWLSGAQVNDLGQAWASAAAWADTDPGADRAARRVESELAKRTPEPMARYQGLRDQGWDRVAAMGTIAHQLGDAEPAPAMGRVDERGRRLDDAGRINPVDLAQEATSTAAPIRPASMTPAPANDVVQGEVLTSAHSNRR